MPAIPPRHRPRHQLLVTAGVVPSRGAVCAVLSSGHSGPCVSFRADQVAWTTLLVASLARSLPPKEPTVRIGELCGNELLDTHNSSVASVRAAARSGRPRTARHLGCRLAHGTQRAAHLWDAHTHAEHAMRPRAVDKQQHERSEAHRYCRSTGTPSKPIPSPYMACVAAGVRPLPRGLEGKRVMCGREAVHNEHERPRLSSLGRVTSCELPVVLPQTP